MLPSAATFEGGGPGVRAPNGISCSGSRRTAAGPTRSTRESRPLAQRSIPPDVCVELEHESSRPLLDPGGSCAGSAPAVAPRAHPPNSGRHQAPIRHEVDHSPRGSGPGLTPRVEMWHREQAQGRREEPSGPVHYSQRPPNCGSMALPRSGGAGRQPWPLSRPDPRPWRLAVKGGRRPSRSDAKRP